MEEFFQQGDLEKSSDLPISYLCDRSTTKIPNSQSGFFQFCALPLYNAWGKLVQSDLSKLMICNIVTNKDYWDKRIKEAEEKEKERKRREELGESIDDIEDDNDDDDFMDFFEEKVGETILPSITIYSRIPKLTITTEDEITGELITRNLVLNDDSKLDDKSDDDIIIPAISKPRNARARPTTAKRRGSIEKEEDKDDEEKIITIDFTKKILSSKVVRPDPVRKGCASSYGREESRRGKTVHFKIDDRKATDKDDDELHLPQIVEKKKVEGDDDVFLPSAMKKKQEKDSTPSDVYLPEIPSASPSASRFIPSQVRRMKHLARHGGPRPRRDSFSIEGERMTLVPRPVPRRKETTLRRPCRPAPRDLSLATEEGKSVGARPPRKKEIAIRRPGTPIQRESPRPFVPSIPPPPVRVPPSRDHSTRAEALRLEDGPRSRGFAPPNRNHDDDEESSLFFAPATAEKIERFRKKMESRRRAQLKLLRKLEEASRASDPKRK